MMHLTRMQIKIVVLIFENLQRSICMTAYKIMGVQIGRIAQTKLENSLTRLEDSNLEYELKMEDLDKRKNDRKYKLYKKRVAYLNTQIAALKLELNKE